MARGLVYHFKRNALGPIRFREQGVNGTHIHILVTRYDEVSSRVWFSHGYRLFAEIAEF